LDKDKPDKSQPSYYAVIPASVRYDKNVPAGAKLLYGEISSLCNKEGYCWAGNEYFAKLYQTNEKTIRNWIGALRDAGHITVSFTYVTGKKEIESRLLRLTDAKSSKITQLEKEQPDSDSTDSESSPAEVGKKFATRGEKNFHTYGKNFPEVGKISSKGGEKICRDNTTNNNTTTTATPDPPKINTDPEPPPTAEKAAAACFSPEEIRNWLAAIDKTLLLTGDFYPKAAAFLTNKALDSGYLEFIFKKCEIQNPVSFNGLFYKIFFAENLAEEYKIKNQTDAPEQQQQFLCPVCGAPCGFYEECPSCGLPADPSPETILLFRELYALPPEKREEYIRRENAAYASCGMEYDKLKTTISTLKHEYGLTVSI